MIPQAETTQYSATSSCRNCGSVVAFKKSGLFTDDKRTSDAEIVECTVCNSHSFISTSEIQLPELYSQGYFHGDEYYDYDLAAPSFQRNFQRKISLIRSNGTLSSPLRILEIGGATGEFFLALQQASPALDIKEYLSLEVSDYARGRALERGAQSLSPFDSNTPQAVSSLKPNLIVAWDVWEHLENPADVFSQYLAMASDDVIIAITTVDSSALTPKLRGRSWRQFHPPTHLNYPSRRAFEVLFSHQELEVIYHKSFGSYRPLGEYAKLLPHLIRRAIPSTLLGFPIYCNTFDTQLVMAQRIPNRGNFNAI